MCGCGERLFSHASAGGGVYIFNIVLNPKKDFRQPIATSVKTVGEGVVAVDFNVPARPLADVEQVFSAEIVAFGLDRLSLLLKGHGYRVDGNRCR